MFLKSLFSFHETKGLSPNWNYPIFVGQCKTQPAFFVQTHQLAEMAIPDDDDAISLKKCLTGLINDYSKRLQQFAEEKYNRH